MPVFLFGLGLVVAALWFGRFAVSQFVEQRATNDLRWRSFAVYRIIDSNLDELQRESKLDDDVVVRERKVEALMAIEDFARVNELKVIVHQLPEERTVELGVDLPTGHSQRSIPLWLSAELRRYTYSFRFEPWRWEVTLTQDNRAYLGLLGNLFVGAGVSTVLFVAGIIGFMFYLTGVTGRPIRKIIQDLERNQPPAYQGITEFEYLGRSISTMMGSIREQSELLEATFANIAEGLCVFDDDLQCLACNKRFLEIYGLTGNPNNGKIEIGPTLSSVLGAPRQELLARTEGHLVIEHVRPSGRVIEVHVNPMGHGRHVSTHADITERKAAEERIKQLYLETQRAVRMRDEFLMVASHELRTPVTSLRLSLQALQRGERLAQPVGAEVMSRSVGLAARQGERLTRLVEDLLDVSRIETGRLPLDLSDVELGVVVRDVVERFEADLTRAGCQITIQGGDAVTGRWDRSRLDQVVTNLLSNAVKFGAGKPIEIVFGEQAGMARLTVRDHGIGIDHAQQAQIFERFVRGVSTRHYGGLGLGLYISRRIIEAHGGKIGVESQPGSGSTFTVELPCSEPGGEERKA